VSLAASFVEASLVTQLPSSRLSASKLCGGYLAQAGRSPWRRWL